MNYFCLEILGESVFHRHLIQVGLSGRPYAFLFNRTTGSYVRAYRRFEDYLAERLDIHKEPNVWPLLSNWLPEESLEAGVFAEVAGGGKREAAGVMSTTAPRKRGSAEKETLSVSQI